jgi:predicted DNA-binding ribbon-helix-helix protein
MHPASDPASEKPNFGHSTLVSRNVTIAGHRTSVRLEPEMWSGLTEICRRERANLHEICTLVSVRKHENTSLTAAIRVFVMAYFRTAATEDGHVKAGHGYNGISISMAATSMPQTKRPSMPGTTTSGSLYAMAANKAGGRRY